MIWGKIKGQKFDSWVYKAIAMQVGKQKVELLG